MRYPTYYPTLDALTACLIEIRDTTDWHPDTDDLTLDVRLQITRSRWARPLVAGPQTWDLWTGLPDYDTDHRGYWGAVTVSPTDSRRTLRAAARDLLAQCADHEAQCA